MGYSNYIYIYPDIIKERPYKELWGMSGTIYIYPEIPPKYHALLFAGEGLHPIEF